MKLILFTGLMFLGTRLIGPGLGWVLPVGYGFVAFLATLLTAQQPGHELQWGKAGIRWAWSLHDGGEHEAALVASLVLVTSLGIMAKWGARDRLEERI